MNDAICVICAEPIDPASSLLSPCCWKTSAHSKCLQESQKFENPSFQCPACAVKRELIENDETSINFFHNRSEESGGLNSSVKVEVGCSADACLCDEGRTRSRVGTQWEVVVCDVCSSAGTHKRCSDVQLMCNQWQCNTCQHITVKLDSSEIPCEKLNDFACENHSLLPLTVCKTEIIEDPTCSAKPEILENDTQRIDSFNSIPQRILQEGHEYNEVNKQDYSLPANPKEQREKPYKCDYDGCDAAFISSSGLYYHRRTHTGQKPHKCVFKGCDATFISSSGLSQHRRIHTGNKTHRCEYNGCGAAFISFSGLYHHRRIHTGEKPHKCDYVGCNAAFSQSSNLKSHRRTHTKDKTYKCDFDGCASAFISCSGLSQHRRTHKGRKQIIDPT